MSAQRRPATKRRSSGQGQRIRRGSQPGQNRAAVVENGASVAGEATDDVQAIATAPEPAPKPVAQAKRASSGGSEGKARTASRSRTAEPERENPLDRVINTQRFVGVQRYYRDTASEIRKVIWPDRDTTRNLTLVVIALSVILGILLGGIDYVLFQVFEAMP